jgi:adenine-specific DNA-methyltransferase
MLTWKAAAPCCRYRTSRSPSTTRSTSLSIRRARIEPRKIDLVETFNYLIGLRVKHIDAQPERGFVTVTGVLPSGESCLVLWRDCDVLDYEGVAKLCDKLAINPADNEFDVVYINGDHNIPTVLTQTAEEGGATRVLKLRQIEPEFLSRMFSVEDI